MLRWGCQTEHCSPTHCYFSCTKVRARYVAKPKLNVRYRYDYTFKQHVNKETTRVTLQFGKRMKKVRLPRKLSTKLNMTVQAKKVRQSLLAVQNVFTKNAPKQICREHKVHSILGNFKLKVFFLSLDFQGMPIVESETSMWDHDLRHSEFTTAPLIDSKIEVLHKDRIQRSK